MPDTDPPKENPLPRKQDKSHAHRKQSSPDNAPPAKRGRSKKSQRRPGRKAKAWVKATSEHPFATVASDHAETPRDAYVDILPLLHACSRACQKKPENLKVWDPYYCAGKVVRLMKDLGFPNVINRNVDFYKTPAPKHDVLMTNPPFSGDHLRRIVDKCTMRDQPFCLLVPNFVIGHTPWRAAAKVLDPPPFYVVPHRRYCFVPPAFARDSSRDGRLLTSPFETMWLCWVPAEAYKLCKASSGLGRDRSSADAGAADAAESAALNVSVDKKSAKQQLARAVSWNHKRVSVFWSLDKVPSEHRDVTDPAKKRPNPKTRKRLAAKRRKRAAGYGGGSWKNINW